MSGSLRSRADVERLLSERKYKVLEREFGIPLRNGQAVQGIRAALRWFLDE